MAGKGLEQIKDDKLKEAVRQELKRQAKIVDAVRVIREEKNI